MIDRRRLGQSALGLALAAALPSTIARSQQPTLFRIANAAGINDPQQIFVSAGRHPRLGFYQAEGVDFELVNVANPSQGMQSVATGETTLASLSPGIFLPIVARDPSFPVIAAYCWLPRNASTIGVKPDSPYQTIADLRGKRIGVRNQGDIGRYVVKTMLRELGLDDAGTDYIAVGDGGGAGTALHHGQVDAIASFDTACARVELAGFKLRYVPLTPGFAATPSGYFGFSKKMVSEKRRELVGFMRAVAKSTIFARTNPAPCIDMHWEMYPESRPKSKSEAEARAEMMFLLSKRMDKWMPRPNDPDQRMGATTITDWNSLITITGETVSDPQLAAKIGDPRKLFTNDMIDDINAFDREAIVRQAKTFEL
ncbi:ABC transporter substrate-binding protein [Bradyrhizobium prioriisuperbiae]|uniref:ABC transporter substrate-binding protein n=1 Tax=Bradyrhizobium prioriisuperbiae TaxID=2854389 RepID=UPI0028E3CD50|nr:ABC transporter substrate-binding protein [Bradyrhizobium prioritasuperba]